MPTYPYARQVKIVPATCTLHNFIRTHQGYLDEYDEVLEEQTELANKGVDSSELDSPVPPSTTTATPSRFVCTSRARWTVLGYVLRSFPVIPAYRAVRLSFTESHADAWRGRPVTTLPPALNDDLQAVPNERYRLQCPEDPKHLRTLAQNRCVWKVLTDSVIAACLPIPDSI
ncbi:hypothetical protein ACHHYP_05866 [Achlya hypogyna]|uniref:DDE Tnp4 domain-containing protein n=1 Tax=Achlya hypogyna TaxID=1202772 RepID=A0A1V9YWF5_ACHHY|nr:hypothetical protein ACHHYP_05866 [Achlya hypogyna]